MWRCAREALESSGPARPQRYSSAPSKGAGYRHLETAAKTRFGPLVTHSQRQAMPLIQAGPVSCVTLVDDSAGIVVSRGPFTFDSTSGIMEEQEEL